MAIWHDAVAAMRTWRRQPAFAAFAVAVTAAGVGAATAVFTLVNAALLRELPLRDPQRLVWIYNARVERDRAPFSIPDLDDYARAASTIDGFAAFTNWTANLTGSGDAERLEGSRVSGTFFRLLGVTPWLGRTIAPSDDSPNSADARVAVLTYGLWVRRFGADPRVVGSEISLNGAAHTIVGVLPPTFLFPFRTSEIAVPLPLRDDPRRTDRGANFLRVVARLKPGVTVAQAKGDLDGIARQLQQRYPIEDARKVGVSVFPLQAEIANDYRRTLWIVFGAVGVLLLIGCGNLANLLLLRAASRRGELAVRMSIGASRARIVQQLTLEAAVLVTVGTMVGLLGARWLVELWRLMGPADFPSVGRVALDGRAVVFAALAALVTIAVCGLVPAWRASRDSLTAIVAPSRTASGGRGYGTMRRAFVALQVMGSSALLIAISLVAQGFIRLQRVETGFTAGHALSVQLSLPPQRYANRAAIAGFTDALAPRLAAVPATRAVGAVSLLPLSGLLNTMDLVFPDRPAPPPDRVPQAHFRMATEGYFAAAGIQMFDGREFDRRDDADRPLVAVVSRTLAERHWPGESAVGRQLKIDSAASPPMTVVGVCADVKQQDIDGSPTADLYIPVRQMPAGQAALVAARFYWVVRTDDEPGAHAQAVRAAVRDVDADVAATSLRTLDQVLDGALARRRASVRMIGLFAQAALLLAVIGVYAVAAFSTAARRRELAIRSVFGATTRTLFTLVIRGELPPIVFGTVAGLGAAALAMPLLADALFRTDAHDPATYAAAAAAMLVVGGAATLIAARHEIRRVASALTTN